MAGRPSGGSKPGVGRPKDDLSPRAFWALALLVGLAGLAVRVIDLSQIPPGLHFDQAANGLLGLEILSGAARPVFFPSYTGREALFMYLIAGLAGLLGPETLAIRLASALAGAVTVVALAALGAALYGRRTGLLSAAFLAGLYWHLHVSRLGERTILVPLLDVLALLFLWWAFDSTRRKGTGGGSLSSPLLKWRGSRGRGLPGLSRGQAALAFAAVGGGLVGLQLYTYPSSRFFVAVVAGIGAIEVGQGLWRWVARKPKEIGPTPGLPRQTESGSKRLAPETAAPGAPHPHPTPPAPSLALGLVAISFALLVATPLAAHFLRAPEDFLGRASQVAIWNPAATPVSAAATLANSVEKTLGMFVLEGDHDWKYNLAGRPVFDPVSGGFFLIGTLAALTGLRRPADRLTLLWLLGMLAPGFLSVDAPQFMRTLGAAPPAALLAARGLAGVAGVGVRSQEPGVRRPGASRGCAGWRNVVGRLAPLLLAWPIAAGGIAVYQYFAVWGPSWAAYYALEGDVTDAAQLIRAEAPRYGTTYVASRYGANPTISYLAGEVFGRLRWFDGRAALPLPPPGAGPTLYVLPRTATDDFWYQYLPAQDRINAVKGPDGADAAVAFALRPGEGLPPAGQLTGEVRFGGVARLIGAEIPTATQAGLPIAPLLTWTLEQPPREPLKFFVHLIDAAGQRWAQYDEDVYPIDQWQAGQTLLVRRPLEVPAEVPPGAYALEIGLSRADGTALGASDPAGRPIGSFWRSPTFSVIRPERPPALESLELGQRFDVPFGGVARLVGAKISADRIQDGDTLEVTLVWQVLATPPSELATVIAALGPGGETIGTSARPTTGGVWPAQDWRAGDVVVDRQSFLVPAGTPAGTLTLAVGLQGADGQALKPASGDGNAIGDALAQTAVAKLTVTERPRAAETAAIQQRQEVAFASGLRLLGYNLEPTIARPGQPLQLRLVWKANRAQTGNWTVFTHLLDAQEKIWAQQDSLPAAGARPTTTWAPGEAIEDVHELVIQPNAPPGAYRLEVGLYDASNGERLRTVEGSDRVLLDQPVTVGQ